MSTLGSRVNVYGVIPIYRFTTSSLSNITKYVLVFPQLFSQTKHIKPRVPWTFLKQLFLNNYINCIRYTYSTSYRIIFFFNTSNLKDSEATQCQHQQPTDGPIVRVFVSLYYIVPYERIIFIYQIVQPKRVDTRAYPSHIGKKSQ